MVKRQRFLLLLVASLGGAIPVAAQRSERQRVEVSTPTLTSKAVVTVRGVLSEKSFDDLLRSGFPLKIHLRAELWRTGRWVDEIMDTKEWDLYVRFDTFDATYEVVRITNDSVQALGTYKRLEDARSAAELPYAPPLATADRGRQHYVAVEADVITMEMSDLDELQRWLRGEVRPVVQGKKNPGTAIGRGLRSIVTRLLGGESRHLEARSERFTL